MGKTKKKNKEEVKPYNFDDIVKKFINSKQKEKDYKAFKKELIQNQFTEEIADIFVRGLKMKLPGVDK